MTYFLKVAINMPTNKKTKKGKKKDKKIASRPCMGNLKLYNKIIGVV